MTLQNVQSIPTVLELILKTWPIPVNSRNVRSCVFDSSYPKCPNICVLRELMQANPLISFIAASSNNTSRASHNLQYHLIQLLRLKISISCLFLHVSNMAVLTRVLGVTSHRKSADTFRKSPRCAESLNA